MKPNLLFQAFLRRNVAFVAFATICFMLHSTSTSAQCKAWEDVGGTYATATGANDLSMTFDNSGNLYITYSDLANSYKATVQKYDGSSWATVGSVGFSDRATIQNVIKLDNTGTPYVAYVDQVSYENKVTVKKYNGSSWVNVGSPRFSSAHVDWFRLDIDAAGVPYVVYADASVGNKATVMKFNGSDWELVGGAGFTAGTATHPSIAIDPVTNEPYIAFSDGANGNATTVMRFSSGSWSLVGTAGFNGSSVQEPVLAFSNSATPYVAYQKTSGSVGIAVSKFSAGSWNTVGANVTTGYASYISFLIDASNTLYVGAKDAEFAGRPFAKKFNGTSWEVVGQGPFYNYWARSPKFALDPDGHLWTAFSAYDVDHRARVKKLTEVSATISGTAALCIGASSTLSIGTTVGAWSSSAANTATIGSSSGVATAVRGGLATISYTIGACAITKQVTVSPDAGAINGPLYVAVGSSISLTGSVSGGVWSSAGSNASVNSSGVVSGLAAGSATISYTVTGGCGTAAATRVINVLPATGTLCRDWEAAGAPVISTGNISGQTVVVDPSGVPYVGFLNTSNVDSFKPTVKRYNGESWETVGADKFGAITGYGFSMAIDNVGSPYVVTGGYSASGINAYKFDGYEWQTIASPCPTESDNPKLKTDAMGSVYVAYISDEYKITVKKYNGATWDVVGPENFTGHAGGIELAFHNTTPYVAFLNSDDYSLSVMRFNGSSWESVGATRITGVAAYNPKMAISSSGTPYVAISDADDPYYFTTVLKFNGTTWETVGGSNIADFAAEHTIAVDAAGDPYIGGLDYTGGGKATVLKFNGSAWVPSGTKYFSPTVALSPDLAIDNSGNAYMIYHNGDITGAATVMKYVVNGSIDPITGASTLCTGNTITLANAGTPGVWSSSAATVAAIGSSTGVLSGVSDGIAVITYTVNNCSVSKHVTVGTLSGMITGPLSVMVGSSVTMGNLVPGGTWSVSNSNASISSAGVVTGIAPGTVVVSYSTTNSCGTTYTTAVVEVLSSTGSCLAWQNVGPERHIVEFSYNAAVTVDGYGRPYLVYANPGAGAVKRFDGSSWVDLGPALTDRWTITPKIEVGPDGTPYAGFFEPENGRYLIKKYNGSSWETISVNTEPHITFALSPSGTVYKTYISYPIVVVEKLVGSTWERVGSSLPEGGWGAASLAFSESGVPHIAYQTASNEIEVAKFDGSDWETIGGSTIAGYSGTSLQLAINSTGTPYIIFSDDFNGQRSTVMQYNGSSWELLGPGGLSSGAAPQVGIAVNAMDEVYIAYSDWGGDFKARVYKYNGSSWDPIGSPSAVSIGWASSVTLAFDPSGSPYLGYADAGESGDSSFVVVKRYAPSSSLSSISGGTSICLGGTATLSNSTAGGTWSSSNEAIATVGSASGEVTGIADGTAIISYTAGSCSATIIVTVSASGGTAGTITGTLSVCTGNTTTLSNATTGGTWSSSNTAVASIGSSTGIVIGAGAGTASITYTLATGCGPINTTAVVTVTATPSAGSITGTLSTCAAATTTLSNATTAGTWSSSNTAVATVGSSTGIVSGVAGGTAVITYTVTMDCGTASTTAVVTVTATPSAGSITGTLTTCTSGTTTLSNAVTGGTWSSSNTAVATVNSTTGVVTGVAAGNATITYTVTNGCGSATATAVVTVTATPTAGTITGTLTTCATATTTLGNATTGGTWSSSNTAVATVNSSTGVVTGVAAGNATITYTVTNSCGSATTTAVVTVNAATSAGTITGTASICTGGTTTLSNAVTGGTWSSSNTAVATVNSTTGVVTGVDAGNATITYTVSGACGTATATTVVTVGATAGAISGSLAICPGTTSSLTTGSAGTWSSSNTSVATIGSASGMLTGVANGTATISFTSGAGCTATAVATVSLPAVLTGTFNTCVGQTSTLSSATTGGVWSSANSAIASVDASTGVVTGVAAGSAYITYTTGTCYRTGNFVVKALPPAISGPVTVCAGGTTYVPPPTATGYSWTSSNSSVATIGSSTGILTGVAAGTTTLTYTTNTGCYTTTVATVNTAPAAITGTTSLCAGSTATLSSATAGGTWSSSNTGKATIGSATGIVTAVNAGTATITYNAGGCRTTTVVTVSAIAAITGSTSMCLGSSVNLSHATSGGTWSSSNTAVATVGTSGTVTGVSAGTASITYTIPSGCSRSVTVTVAATPGGVTGTLTACPGTTTTLGSATAGGTWGGGNATIATINSSTGVVSGIGAGTITATYTIGTGCRSTAIVTINPLPAVMTGTFNVCVGLASTLASASAGGTWSTANAAIATADPSTGAITGVAAGTVAVSYTLPTGCYRSGAFTVKALPPAPAASAACEGTTTAIPAPSTNGRSWSSSNTSVATIGSSSGVMTGVTAGTTVLTYTTITGCYSTTVATVYTLPSAGTIIGPTTVIAGNTITLDNATTGGVWSSSNTSRATIGAATGIVTGVAAGSATISYSVSNPGCTVRATQVISVTASRDNSPATAAATAVQLYPNPTTGAFTVVSQEAGMLSVYSLDGKQVTGYSIAAGANQLTLPADLAAGIYMCRYTSESGASTMVRLVYER